MRSSAVIGALCRKLLPCIYLIPQEQRYAVRCYRCLGSASSQPVPGLSVGSKQRTWRWPSFHGMVLDV